MKFTRRTLATSMIAAAGAAGVALGLSATAAADPAAAAPAPAAPAPAPSVPGLPFLQQLATNPAAATQLIQGLTSMLGGAMAVAGIDFDLRRNMYNEITKAAKLAMMTLHTTPHKPNARVAGTPMSSERALATQRA